MSHSASSVQIRILIESLRDFDRSEFQKLHFTKCQKCHSGRLHKASYSRNLRGFGLDDPDFTESFERYSLCCSVCRRRTTPVSALFAARRVYSAVVLVAFMVWPRVQEKFKYPNAVTRRRWKAWWEESRSVTLWAMQICAVTGRSDLPLPQLVRALATGKSGGPCRVRVLTFHPDILWGYCSRRG